jgi:hypothetical protein
MIGLKLTILKQCFAVKANFIYSSKIFSLWAEHFEAIIIDVDQRDFNAAAMELFA